MPAPWRHPRLLACVLSVLALAGCGSSSSSQTTSSSSQTAASSSQATTGSTASATASTASAAPAPAAPGCKTVAAPTPKGPQHLHPPRAPLAAGHAYTVVLTTNCGAIDIRLDVRDSPKTSASFAALVSRGFFDDLTFHRIVPGFVIQGGDPLGTGLGGPGYEVVEAPPPTTQYTMGVVAMAKTATDPSGASGSQFFIVLGANVGLPPQYALLGHVTGSFAAVARIGAVPTNPQTEMPTSPVVIERAALRVS